MWFSQALLSRQSYRQQVNRSWCGICCTADGRTVRVWCLHARLERHRCPDQPRAAADMHRVHACMHQVCAGKRLNIQSIHQQTMLQSAYNAVETYESECKGVVRFLLFGFDQYNGIRSAAGMWLCDHFHHLQPTVQAEHKRLLNSLISRYYRRQPSLPAASG